MTPVLTRRATFGVFAASALELGCGHKEDVIVKTGADAKLTDAGIDKDPVPLLPGNAIGVLSIDAPALFNSRFGDQVRAVVEKRLPLPASAGFEPKRDLDHVWLGFYSMQGADMAGVAVGRFDPQKIEAAADGTQPTPLGVPVVKTSYAGRTLYTAGTVGFSVLTQKTALIGNDTGMRRALDRIEEGRARRELPAYMDKLLAASKAPVIGGFDFTSSPLPDATRQELPFLNGINTLSVVGNFDDPGLNLAGTLTYDDADAAQRGAQNLVSMRQLVERYAPFLALLGIRNPVQRLEAEPKDKDVSFVAAIDGAAVAALLDKAQAMLVRH
ncbi:MAG TPA: hypothetical protein VMI54_17215 [Polyangiaceae bacterium]|nr:hypothetical protein [Polyangiaceae bacterium]